MLIAFEGLDGSGSSTQAKLLAESLQKEGKSVLLTKEPTDGTPIGKLIREVLQHQWEASPEGLQLLFSADRAEHLRNLILPALNSGKIVITDRYLLSTLAFGGLGIEIEWLKELNKKFVQPDLTFLLKLSPEDCLKRIAKRGNQTELFEKKEKLERVWQNYENLSQDTSSLFIIDAQPEIETIHQQIKAIVDAKLA